MRTVQVTLARFALCDRAVWLEAAAHVLNAGERRRLEAIADPDLRTGHALGRALMRLIAAEASRFDPRELTVVVARDGKPWLQELPQLSFSVSHSGRVVAVAASSAAAVGVDVEQPRATIPQPRRLAQRTFASSEMRTLGALPADRFSESFSQAWTIKEAVGKALGVGVVPALSGVVVQLSSRPPRLAAVEPGPPPDSWTLHQLAVPGGRERLVVALPAPGIVLTPVAALMLSDFKDWIDAQPATDRRCLGSERRYAAR